MIKLGSQLNEAAEQLEREKGIPRAVFVESIKEAMMAAYKRYAHIQELEDTELYEVRLYEKTGEIGVFQRKAVVDKVEDETLEVDFHTALGIDADIQVGENVYVEVTPTDFGRIAAQAAKQVMMQRIRESEKQLVYTEFEERKHTVTPAVIQRIEGRNVIVSLGRLEAIMPTREQIPGEYYRVGSKIRVFVADVRDNGRTPQIVVSQSHPEMVREVFELEVPEIEDGLVELKAISREAGFRTKVAVHSTSPDVDPQGACIGARGARIQAIVNELKNEKIDIIRWAEDPIQFIINALEPAKIMSVDLVSDEPGSRMAQVVVPDDHLSLPIGRVGQNVRLAARLTGWKLDIKSLSQIREMAAQEAAEEAGENGEAYAEHAEGEDDAFSTLNLETEYAETESEDLAEADATTL